VSERTRRILETVKGQGESFDDVLQDLLEDSYFDDEFYAEIERRWRAERRVPGSRVIRKAGLARTRTGTSSSSRRKQSSWLFVHRFEFSFGRS